MICPRLAAVLALAALVAPSTFALADEARPLVVDATTFAETPRVEPIEAFLQDVTPLTPGTYPIVAVSDPVFIESLRWFIPTASGADCERVPISLPQALREGRAAWNQLDLEGSLTAVTQARESLACQAEIIDAQTYKALLFLEGAAHYFLEDNMAATTFTTVANLFPDETPESGYPPEVVQAYRAAVSQGKATAWITVRVPEDLAVYKPVIDGFPVGDRSAVDLKPGRHFLQIQGPEGQVRNERFTIFPGTDQDLARVTDIMPARAQVISATIRTEIASGRPGGATIAGMLRYAHDNHHPYVLFVVPDVGSEYSMRLRSLMEDGSFINGPPSDFGNLETPETPLPPRPGGSPSGVKPPRERGGDGAPMRTMPDVKPTPFHAGLAFGVLLYDGGVFGTVEPRFEVQAGPISLAATGIFGIGSDDAGLLTLPGGRLELLKRFYVGPFAPHGGVGYSVFAARVVDAGSGPILLLEGTPEVFGGTEFAPLDLGLRITARVGVGFTPGIALLGVDGTLTDDSRLLISAALGAGWTF